MDYERALRKIGFTIAAEKLTERERLVFSCRVKGLSLETIAYFMCSSRERIAVIEKKVLVKIRPLIEEYEKLFELNNDLEFN